MLHTKKNGRLNVCSVFITHCEFDVPISICFTYECDKRCVLNFI